MNTCHCCPVKTRAIDNVPRPASRLHRGGEIAGWVVPSVTLALLPKCPVCVAAYVALVTGIGISLPTATSLRTMLVVLCVASLVFIVIRRLQSFLIAQGQEVDGIEAGKGTPFPNDIKISNSGHGIHTG